MESLSRPFHRRKLSNANSFSGKNAYDGVFSGHRPKFDGVPVVNVEEYREIFSSSQAASSIPVLDLSTLQESSDGSNLELGSTNPDYGKIFGGFRDEDIAVSYEELIARDKASSEDVGSEALKQYNMSYHKISQRNKDGLDVTTHVTKLHAVPGFTCFIDESASQQPKKETKIQKSSIPNDVQKETSQTPVESHNSKVSSINTEAASQPKMETEKKKSSETDKLESKSKYHQVESLSGDKKVDLESHNSNVSSSPATNGEPNKETDKKKSSETDNVDPINSRNGDFPEIKTSQSAVESKSKYHQDDKQTDLKSHNSKVSSTTNGEPTSQSKKETDKKKLSDDSLEKQTAQRVDRISKNFVADINIPPATSATNVDDNHEDDEKRSNPTSTWTWKTDNKHGTWFDEEVDVNSAAGASAAALRKAIEKAQESIRIAKESVGRKKEGLKSFSTKSFKDSLKVKKARVENVRTGEEEEEEQKVKDSWIQEFFKARVASVKTPQVSESTDGENEINRNILESEKKSEMVKGCCHELKDNCDDKDETKGVEYATRSPEEVENNTNESLEKDKQRPNGLFVIGSCENKVRDSEDTIKDEVGPSNGYKMIEETNNLTLYEKVEDEKKVSHDCDENGYEKRLGLLENIKQDVVEHEGNEEVVASDDEESEKVFEEEREVKEDSEEEEEEEKEEEEEEEDMKFYDVCEVEIIENSSSDYDDAEESDIIHVANRIEIDTQEVNDVDQKVELSEEVDDISKVDQSDNNTESSQEVDDVSKVDQSDNNVESSEEVDDVSISLPQVTVEEKEILETIQTGSINNEDKCEEMSDDELSSCDLADMESSSDTIHGMEIEVKEYKESIKKQEESNLQESHSERPEIIFEMETGTSKDMNDEAKEHEANKVMEKKERERERERERLAVERVIREARERSFNEVREKVAIERQRVMADVEKANSMKASDIINSRIKAERAAVERATAEARQRALEKAMSQNKVSEANDDLHVSNGTSVESALRSKAKLEKHNRIMERAAKALAEKEKRDQLAQKEQAERNRLSENLDADIKRWSTGKEGNLRALLSTLQYILGPESGWQSVSLTEIITTTAVKKAYRKATLCVHPDKLQQRGASIQQKYICEKVFDLLKAAWNKFNSEER